MTTFIAPATFDYVCHSLQCPRCNRTPTDPCAIDLQTKLCRQPAMAHLRVGDQVDLRDDILAGGYLVTRARREPLRVIEAWSCPECGSSFLWAILELRDHVLVSVKPTPVDERVLEDVDYITGEVLALFPLDRTVQVASLDPLLLRVEIGKAEAKRLADMFDLDPRVEPQ